MDAFSQLPRDQNAQATPEELRIVDSIFRNEASRSAIYDEMRPIIYAGLFFLIFSLPFVDGLIAATLPIAQSRIVRLAIKTVLFMLFLYTVMLWCDPTR
jgi:hypothetical protein